MGVVCALLLAVLLSEGGWGAYPVRNGTIPVIPGLKESAPRSGWVVYPVGAGPFPLVIFGHGMGSGGAVLPPHYHTLLKEVASRGMVVVSPESCPTGACLSLYAKDMLATIDACRNKSLHPALEHADLSRVGIFGHSQGAMATVRAATYHGYNIKVAVSMHPCFDPFMIPTAIHVPVLYTTGDKDTVCSPLFAEALYDLTVSDKVLFDIKGANHEEPTDNGCQGQSFCPNRGDIPTAQFLSCYLLGTDCDAVYGSTGEMICNQQFELTKCRVHNHTK